MLVLKRKIGESVTIGTDITVTLKKCGGNTSQLAIHAPRSVAVIRTELLALAKNKEKTSKQARLEGSDEWNDYGNVSLYDAARQEAIATAKTKTEHNYEWLVEVRDTNDDTNPPALVRIRTFISAEIVD